MSPENFIKKYESALASQDWSNVEPLMHENAAVTFSDGSVHEGRKKVEMAFKKNFSIIKSEEYSVENVRWILKNETTAVYLFDFYWKGIINDKEASGTGIGTSVLIQENGNWVLLTENLGKKA